MINHAPDNRESLRTKSCSNYAIKENSAQKKLVTQVEITREADSFNSNKLGKIKRKEIGAQA